MMMWSSRNCVKGIIVLFLILRCMNLIESFSCPTPTTRRNGVTLRSWTRSSSTSGAGTNTDTRRSFQHPLWTTTRTRTTRLSYIRGENNNEEINAAAAAAANTPTNTKTDPISNSNVHILILPGFGNSAHDYLVEGSLVSSLQKRGWPASQIHVLPLERIAWVNVFLNGMMDVQFWKGTAAPTRPAFRWYLQRTAEEIQKIHEMSQQTTGSNPKIVLMGHSAGGWLARAAMGFDVSLEDNNNNHTTNDSIATTTEETTTTLTTTPPPAWLESVIGLVTLGTPHVPPQKTDSDDSKNKNWGVVDLSRGALRITHEAFPGAFHDDMFYITITSNAIQGMPEHQRKYFWQPHSLESFAYESYDIVCGNGQTIGDGVVPVCVGHLENAKQLHLEQLFHSNHHVSAAVAATADNNGDSNDRNNNSNYNYWWYGCDSGMEQWYEDFLEEVHKVTTNTHNNNNNSNCNNK